MFAVGWDSTRKIHIAKFPMCAACGYIPERGCNDSHHIIPRHINPALIYDQNNLITLCTKYSCHLRFGHFGDYRRYWNPDIQKMLSGVGSSMRLAELLERLSSGGGTIGMDIEKTVIDIFTGQIGRQARAEDLLASYNLNRLAKVDVCSRLDKIFGLSLDVSIFEQCETVRSVSTYIVDLGVW